MSVSLKTFVTDRAGHGRRYAFDETKARGGLDFATERGFDEGLRQTLRWYLGREASGALYFSALVERPHSAIGNIPLILLAN